MPTTAAPWNLRYPVLTDTANPPRDLGYLAADVAAALAVLATPPSCRVSLTADVSGWAVATAPIVWAAENYDVFPAGGSKMHSTTTNPERLTIRTAGRYRVHSMVTLYAASGIAVQLQVFKNTSAAGPSSWDSLAYGFNYTSTLTDEIVCNVGDYLTLQVTPFATGLTLKGTLDVHMVATWVSL